MGNKDLQAKYDEMHKQGASAWYGDGREERETILKMGEPWFNLKVVEIGCGEGELSANIIQRGAYANGIDYSAEAIRKAKEKYPEYPFISGDYHEVAGFTFDRLVMQGVLEHLDDPFTELKWMMDNLLGEHGDVITSSPCFLNPRGIVWMTLDMLGAVMSKTDLHFLHPWQFEEFCEKNSYKLSMHTCDWSWGNGPDMISDLMKRIPLALRDGGISQRAIFPFLQWLERFSDYRPDDGNFGATMVYRITK